MRHVLARTAGTLLFAGIVSALVGAQYASLEVQPLNEQQATADSAAPVDETPSAWFVELSGAPVADGGTLATLRQQKSAFRTAARAAGVTFRERYAFDTLWNGLSIDVSRGDLSKIVRISGVSAIYPVLPVSLPDTTMDVGANPQLETAIAMTGADVAQDTLGFTGEGINVAVMDTGIDYDHPDLGGCFGPACRVMKGWDFVGDAYAGGGANIQPDGDPDDCNGHGTHVAGIVGANGSVKGVAPNVNFYAYRVFGCTGSTTSDIMIAAMERALADGADILSMSIGSDLQWPQYPTAAASDRLVNKGIVVVAAIGNRSEYGVYGASAPGVGDKVIGVASVDNSYLRQHYFTATPDGAMFGYNQAAQAPAAPTSGTNVLARTGNSTSTADACSPLAAGSLTGKVALIRRGTCSFNIKANNAQVAGAVGVVIYNNVAGVQSITVLGPPAITIPVVSISDLQGKELDSRLAAGAVTIAWTDQIAPFINNGTGGMISSFSSYGLAADLSLKPDVAAPGGMIYSTFPLEAGGYATLSGTSMATPHVSGAVALLLQARPHTPPMMVRSLLQDTAAPFLWGAGPSYGFLENVHRQGAGLLRIDRAITSGIKVEPSTLALGESESGPATRTLTFTNMGTAPVTLGFSHKAALATGGNTYTPSFFTGSATVTFSSSAVTVPAGGTASVDVTIGANTGWPNMSLYGGYIVAKEAASGAEYRVPYSGLKGDYQSVPVLVPTTYLFPWLAKLDGGSYVKQTGTPVYTMAADDIPYFLVHFQQQSRTVRMDVFDANTGKSWHRALQLDYFGRNSSATGFYAISFDGQTYAAGKTYTVPSGTYVMTVSVLKALGDASNPAHWETWTSPSFTVARP
jgi:minor extracellular serine protease Vpr